MTKSHINIHHTAIFAPNDKDHQFIKVNHAHKARWGNQVKSSLGYHGGYHYLIERDGTVNQFRKESEIGVHNNISRMNFRAIGVCFAGNMSRQKLTDEQVIAGYELIQDILKRHKMKEVNVRPHRYYKATQCPGNFFPDPVLDYLKDTYAEVKEGKEPELKDWEKEAIAWGIENKISNGKRATEDATRVEVIQMIKNAFDKLNK